MKRIAALAIALLAVTGAWLAIPVRAATFPINYSDPASDVVRLNSTTGLCETLAGTCISSPDPHDVNIQWVRGREFGTGNSWYNLTIQVQGRIRNLPNTSYVVDLYADATNRTHWLVNYTDGRLLLYMNTTGAQRVNITGNATIWGPNPASPDSVSMFVSKARLGGPSNLSASVNIDATAIMRGDPRLGQPYSYQDFGWDVPGHPASSPTLLKGHVYEEGTTTGVPGATVLVSGGASVLTNATGSYEVSLSPGTYNVTASKEGYDPATVSVSLASGQTVTKDIGIRRSLAASIGNWLVPIVAVIALLAVVVVAVLLRRRARRRSN